MEDDAYVFVSNSQNSVSSDEMVAQKIANMMLSNLSGENLRAPGKRSNFKKPKQNSQTSSCSAQLDEDFEIGHGRKGFEYELVEEDSCWSVKSWSNNKTRKNLGQKTKTFQNCGFALADTH